MNRQYIVPMVGTYNVNLLLGKVRCLTLEEGCTYLMTLAQLHLMDTCAYDVWVWILTSDFS